MTVAVRRSLASLSVPNYRRYFTGQVVSLTGNWMQTVAEMWLIVKLTGSGVSVGLTAGLQFLPPGEYRARIRFRSASWWDLEGRFTRSAQPFSAQ